MVLCRIPPPGDAFFWQHFAVAELSLMTLHAKCYA
jgi:hypothetical protein